MKCEELIKRISTGDGKAFEKLYDGYVKLVYATAYSITRNHHDAEDVTAEAFVTVWNKAGSFSGKGGKSWLCTIAKNLALTHVKRAGRTTATDDETAFGSYRIEDEVDDKHTVERALGILSDEERETVLMFNSGLKHREIAELNGEPLGTVTWRYNNALKKMRKFLTGGEK